MAAMRMEKIMWDFLWFGVDDSKRDYLIRWEVCCELGLCNLVSKNISLVVEQLWRSPLEPTSLWHKVIRIKYAV